ncbi:hypothetical protein J6E39_09680 [bacterium]|nr:hypothetical protein [bacterium]
MDYRLENLKIDFIIFSVIVFGAVLLCAFADFYTCSITELYRPFGYILVNYISPIILLYLGSMLGTHNKMGYFSISVLAFIWFAYFTIANTDLAYRLPF